MADKLTGVHPLLRARVAAILHEMDAIGHPMIVTDGVRSAGEQFALWLKGRDITGNRIVKPALVVTHCDGIHNKSNHQTKPDGYGHAVDCTFVIGGKPRWSDLDPWDEYGQRVRAHGLLWGGDWPSNKVDRPHVELPTDMTLLA